MPKRLDPSLIGDDNPEWSDADFARATRAFEALPAVGFEGRVPRAPEARLKRQDKKERLETHA